MADNGFMGRSNGTSVKLIDDAKSKDEWNKRGYFSKVAAHHGNLHRPSDGGGMRESLADQHQSLFGKVAKNAAQDTYRPSRQNSLHIREYVFGSMRQPEPHVDMSAGWTEPSHSEWALPPEVPLSKVTNDVEEAVNFLRGSARPPAAANAFRGDHKSSAYSPSMYEERRESATARIIDSKEAARKYGGQSATTPVIDSKEAAKKYGGRFIWWAVHMVEQELPGLCSLRLLYLYGEPF